MSLKKVEQVKKDRFFKIWDVLIYAVVALVIAALFLTVFLTRDTSALTGVEGYYNNSLAFSYDFEKQSLNIVLTANVRETEGEEGTVTLIFCEDGGSFDEMRGYNIIVIDRSARTVKVTQTDCSNREDCVHTPAIQDSSGSIVCTPHRLRIIASDYASDGENLPIG